jgi:hypothetical protein
MQNFTAVDETGIGWSVYIKIILFVFTLVSFLIIGHSFGYKEGQIDALNGKQMFEMQVRQDTLYIPKPQ